MSSTGGARGDDPAVDFTGTWQLRQRPPPTSGAILLAGYRESGGATDDAFELRRLVYGVADLHSALGHFIFTRRPDLLALALADLRAQVFAVARHR